MEALEVSGRSVEEAVETALQELGLSRSEVDIEILQEGRRSILGLGGENAVVRVTPLALKEVTNEPIGSQDTGSDREMEPGEAAETAKEVLEKLTSLMGVEGSVKVIQPQDGSAPPILEFENSNPGVLIGRRGQALSALQYMVNFIASRQFKSGVRVMVDVAGYRRRRQEELRNMAIRIADLVKTNRRSITLEPMGAWERRIVHLTLRDERDITTGSVGFGERRKVVISPKKQSETRPLG